MITALHLKRLTPLFAGVVLFHNSHAQTMNGKIDKVDQYLQKNYPASEPGLAIGLVADGKLVFKKGYGMADLASTEKITPATLFNIASMTKQFTGMAIRKLADSGQISLSDTIGAYLPGLSPVIGSHITIAQLLSHQSGIPDHYNYVEAGTLKHAYDEQVLAAVMKMDSLTATPGTRYHYSNTAFCLLGMVVEKRTGQLYADYLKKELLLPAGMKHSFIWREDRPIPVVAAGYDKSKNGFARSGPDENVFFSTEADGGLYTSVDDYLHWVQYMLPQMPPAQFTINAQSGLQYGYGWFIRKLADKTMYLHSGSNGGFRSYVIVVPASHFALFLFSNRSDKNIEEQAQRVFELLLPESGVLPLVQGMTN
ncbi:MAG: beta-lactamase family protein [Bacteroidetes bacterium]|nr:beta-lactamase family protein [Bacteroidota bacterium]